MANGDMFTAGNDLADFAAAGAAASAPKPEDGNPLLPALARSRTPIVAAVNGRAVGIGTTMLRHCDMVIVANDASLITPFVNLALVPEAASSLLMPLRIGHVRAFNMFARRARARAGSELGNSEPRGSRPICTDRARHRHCHRGCARPRRWS